jgi:arginase
MNSVRVLGAATSAGTHHAGQERAPDALRAGGFVVRETFRADRTGAAARNEAATTRAAHAVAAAVERSADPGSVLVVLGGDCTVTLGVLAGLQRAEPDAGLTYFDGDADLGTPGDGSGILDATGIAHLLGYGDHQVRANPAGCAEGARRAVEAASRLVVLTEVNPSYDPDGDSLDRYIDAVTGALIAGLAG